VNIVACVGRVQLELADALSNTIAERANESILGEVAREYP
jgi:hypothetical protein